MTSQARVVRSVEIALPVFAALLCGCFSPAGSSGTTSGSTDTGVSGSSSDAPTSSTATPTTTVSTTIDGSSGEIGTSGTSGTSGTTGTTGADSSAVGDSSTGEEADGATTDATTLATDPGSTGSTGPSPVCGDGMIEGIEDCEDGNQVGGDGCGSDCRRDARFVFVSSMQYKVDAIANLTLADAICQGLAEEGDGIPMVAKNSIFVAWLSNEGVDAASRIGDSTLPYRRTDLVKVAASKAALLVPEGLEAAIDRDEDNVAFALDLTECGENSVWTGTVAGGFDSTFNCSSWMSSHIAAYATTGNTGSINGAWTNQTECSCAATRHLYCFEVG